MPVDVTCRRKAPGVYGVYKRIKPSSTSPTIVGVLLGPYDAHLGTVQRMTATTWRAKFSAAGSDWTAPIFRSRDAAVTSLTTRREETP